MYRGTSTVRGTDTAVHGVRIDVRATAPFQRYLASFQEDDDVDPNDALSEALPTNVRRKAGAFFTSPQLADALVAPFARELKGDPIVIDPTCGAGDLLLAAAKQFKKARDPARRLERWEQRLHGRDLFEEFVLSARLRMFRAAQIVDDDRPDPYALFPGIKRGCSLRSFDAYEGASHVLLNPPYTLVRAPKDCSWRTGRVSIAALFMEVVGTNCEAGTRVAAVLPDVLRSGSGYAKWREMLGKLLDIERVQTIGRFARWADVDVFLLHGKVRTTGVRDKTTWPLPRVVADRLGEHCTISVGSVVDYRSPMLGVWRPYLTVDHAPAWERVVGDTLTCRRFAGRAVKPPFVVVRRTSRAGDTHRIVATTITGTKSVAVENHLLVLVPKAKTLSACEEIVVRLGDARTTRWLNKRIRCRHLTVGAVHDLPWWQR